MILIVVVEEEGEVVIITALTLISVGCLICKIGLTLSSVHLSWYPVDPQDSSAFPGWAGHSCDHVVF